MPTGVTLRLTATTANHDAIAKVGAAGCRYHRMRSLSVAGPRIHPPILIAKTHMMELRNTGPGPTRNRHIARVGSAPGIAAPSGGPARADAPGRLAMPGMPPSLATHVPTTSRMRVLALSWMRIASTERTQ